MPRRGLYTAERLADVLALIQVLALDPHAHRSVDGLEEELQGKPRSGESSWQVIAEEHPEFFRVKKEESGHPVSLLARHVIPRDATGARLLPSDMTYRLLQTAIDLHDREANAARRWDQLKAVLVGGLVGLIPGLLAVWVSLHHANCGCK